MNTLLIVEDDRMSREMLKSCLEHKNFIVFEAVNGKRSIEILDHHKVNLILLDLHLPDGNGLDLLKKIRIRTDVPVIIVSGEDASTIKVKGLNLGADDFISKPFHPDELVARIDANIRRHQGQAANKNDDTPNHPCDKKVVIGDWTLHKEQFQIFDKNNKSGDLTIREFHLLNALIESAGRPLRREDLCEAIREDRYIPTPRAIDVKITRVRKKINDEASNPQIIQTIRGVGYMLVLKNQDIH